MSLVCAPAYAYRVTSLQCDLQQRSFYSSFYAISCDSNLTSPFISCSSSVFSFTPAPTPSPALFFFLNAHRRCSTLTVFARTFLFFFLLVSSFFSFLTPTCFFRYCLLHLIRVLLTIYIVICVISLHFLFSFISFFFLSFLFFFSCFSAFFFFFTLTSAG